MSGLKEVVPKTGLLFQEQSLHPVLCKPKLLPLKSVTLEKLEKMQKDAQQKVWQQEMIPAEDSTREDSSRSTEDSRVPTESKILENGPMQGENVADIWEAGEDSEITEDVL